MIEATLLNNDAELYILAVDFAKCFDRVPQKIVLALARDLGMHERILGPLEAMYSGLQRRFKLPLGVGSEFEVTNGILQGCPQSVILINALLSVLVKAIALETTGADSLSYADDATIFASSEEQIQAGVDIVATFCGLTGMALNPGKTFALGIRKALTNGNRPKYQQGEDTQLRQHIISFPHQTHRQSIGCPHQHLPH